MSDVVLYSTTSAATLKLKTDIYRIKLLLDLKRVQYEEVCAGGGGDGLQLEPRWDQFRAGPGALRQQSDRAAQSEGRGLTGCTAETAPRPRSTCPPSRSGGRTCSLAAEA